MKKNSVKSQKEAEDFARKLFMEGKFVEVCEFSQPAIELFPKSYELWKILGAALGGLGKSKEARRSFLAALEIAPNDATSIANYITSCFHDGDTKSAIAAVELYFDELPNETQSVVLNSLAEAIQTGQISEKLLPPVIVSLFENDGDVLGDLETDPNAGQDKGSYSFNKQEVKDVISCLTGIQEACEKMKGSAKSGKLSVLQSEDTYHFIEDKLIELAVILDGALE